MASGSTPAIPTSDSPPRHAAPPSSSSSPFATCRLAFDAAAASNSSQAVVWVDAAARDEQGPRWRRRPSPANAPTDLPLPSSLPPLPPPPPPVLIYSSHSVLHLATREEFTFGSRRTGGDGVEGAREDAPHDNKEAAAGFGGGNDDDSHRQNQIQSAKSTPLWRRQASLRSSRTNLFSNPAQLGGRDEVITCLANVKAANRRCGVSSGEAASTTFTTAVAVGYSSGRILVWMHQPAEDCDGHDDDEEMGASCRVDVPPWREYTVLDPFNVGGGASETAHPVTALDGAWLDGNNDDAVGPAAAAPAASRAASTLVLLTGSCVGAAVYVCRYSKGDGPDPSRSGAFLTLLRRTGLLESPLASVRIVCHEGDVLFLLGTASPRNNKIHVYQSQQAELSKDEAKSTGTTGAESSRIRAAGALHGHQDWVTCLDWRHNMLATGSKDCRIRLWDFSVKQDVKPSDKDSIVDTASTTEPRDSNGDGDGGGDIEAEGHDVDEDDEQGESRLDLVHRRGSVASLGPSQTSVLLEALLIGHEASVTSVQWHPDPSPVFGGRDLILLSASMDRTILIWALQDDGDGSGAVNDKNKNSKDCGVWTPLPRLGVAGGILGGPLGSSLLGFCRAEWEPRYGRSIVGHAYGGALHIWTLDNNTEDVAASPLIDDSNQSLAATIPLFQWRATPGLTGHFNAVTDLCWEGSQGSYLLSVSKDQTCRLWAPMHTFQNGVRSPVWTEISRPQVHGYDLMSVSSLSTCTSPHRIVTAADEKELRVYDAPLLTLQALEVLCGADLKRDSQDAVDRALRAYIPSLGLTNKSSVADKAEEEEQEEKVVEQDDADLPNTHVPFERDLGVTSVWPEHTKLYGHDSEMYRVTSTVDAGAFPSAPDDRVLVASSTKAREADAASIRLWDATNGECLQILSSHKSTVVTMSFSSNGQFLATSGKDRRICLWEKQKDGGFSIAWLKDSAHKRIIWSIHFNPTDPSFFASGSRDGFVKVWKITGEGDGRNVSLVHAFAPTPSAPGKPIAVTAISFAPQARDRMGYLAVGMDSGRIEVWQLPMQGVGRPVVVLSIPLLVCHGSAVTKLAWRCTSDDRAFLCLASSSFDHGCKIYEITWKEQ